MPRRLVIFIGAALFVALVLSAAGCGDGSPGTEDPDAAQGSTTTTTVYVAPLDGVLEAGDGLAAAKQGLVQVLGLATADLRVSTLVPRSPGADAVVVWTAGRAEIDSATGRVYFLSTEIPHVDPRRALMSDTLLKCKAEKVPALLGWGDGTLHGLGFRQVQAGAISPDTDLYTLVWDQYAGDGSVTDGSIEIRLDPRSGETAWFSLWPAAEGPEIAGALGAADAMSIAETHIFLQTKTAIPLAGDGSLILMGKKVSQELKMVKDRKITRDKQVLTWVISLSGLVGDEAVGGTVYVDATTGEVLAYEALSDE
ncbi:MAG: hypothetical protein JW990_17815 [Thermoleophilia bacterium]|nr:hypothetical protein [Thermoleophilia bacterium]